MRSASSRQAGRLENGNFIYWAHIFGPRKQRSWISITNFHVGYENGICEAEDGQTEVFLQTMRSFLSWYVRGAIEQWSAFLTDTHEDVSSEKAVLGAPICPLNLQVLLKNLTDKIFMKFSQASQIFPYLDLKMSSMGEYICYICSQSFADFDDFLEHANNKHLKNESVRSWWRKDF